MKRGRTPYPFYNPSDEQRKETLKAHRELSKHIKDELYVFAGDLAVASKALRLIDKTGDPRLKRETTWEKYHRTGSSKLEPELLRRLKHIIDDKKLNAQDDIDKELYRRIGDLKSVKSWYQQGSKISKPKKDINYGYETDLNWLVFGSDEGLDELLNDPLLSAFLMGFHSLNKPLGACLVSTSELVSPQGQLEQWCIDNDVPIPQADLKIAVPLVDELQEEVRKVLKSLTGKQRTALILVLIEKNSYEKAGKKIGVNKKTVYERLWGKNSKGGAIRKIKDNEKLKKIAKSLGYTPTKGQSAPIGDRTPTS